MGESHRIRRGAYDVPLVTLGSADSRVKGMGVECIAVDSAAISRLSSATSSDAQHAVAETRSATRRTHTMTSRWPCTAARRRRSRTTSVTRARRSPRLFISTGIPRNARAP